MKGKETSCIADIGDWRREGGGVGVGVVGALVRGHVEALMGSKRLELLPDAARGGDVGQHTPGLVDDLRQREVSRL